MKNSTIYKFILALVLLLFVVGLTFFVLRTMEQEIDLVKGWSAKDNQNRNFEFGNQLRDNLSELLVQEAIIKNSFISSTNVLGFIQGIEDAARQRGLQITIDKVENKKDISLDAAGMTLNDSEFTLQVKGSYDQVLLFIDDLVKNDKKLSLNQVNMYRNNNEGIVQYTTQIKLTGIMLSYE